jgi:hypothetical protein
MMIIHKDEDYTDEAEWMEENVIEDMIFSMVNNPNITGIKGTSCTLKEWESSWCSEAIARIQLIATVFSCWVTNTQRDYVYPDRVIWLIILSF